MTNLTAETGQEQQLSLTGSLRRYWPWLLGVALFPPAAFLGFTVLGVPGEVFIVPVFVVFAPLGLAWVHGRAPFSLWMVAMGIWMASICVTVFLLLPLWDGRAAN
jgi:hypothetical protein